MERPKAEKRGGSDGNRLRSYIALALVVIAAAMLMIWLVFDDDDSSQNASSKAEIVSTEALEDEVADEDPPAYWAGERQGTELELSRPDGERIYVRYLTDGAKAGDPKADFLTIGTYAAADAVAELKHQGEEPGGVVGTAPGGATVYFNRSQPLSVYVAFPDVDAQIEIYDPRFRQALQLVNSGQIVPIPAD
jgi:hypothetical protein